MNIEAEIDALKLRLVLLERILAPVWTSALQDPDVPSQEHVRKTAEDRLEAEASAIRQEFAAAKGAHSIFQSHLRSLKTLINTTLG